MSVSDTHAIIPYKKSGTTQKKERRQAQMRKILSKQCSKCNAPLRLITHRMAGLCQKCAMQIIEDMKETVKDPVKMQKVKDQCKEKGLSEKQIKKGIKETKKMIKDT